MSVDNGDGRWVKCSTRWLTACPRDRPVQLNGPVPEAPPFSFRLAFFSLTAEFPTRM